MKKAFTLIELFVVIIIISICAALILPAMAKMKAHYNQTNRNSVTNAIPQNLENNAPAKVYTNIPSF